MVVYFLFQGEINTEGALVQGLVDPVYIQGKGALFPLVAGAFQLQASTIAIRIGGTEGDGHIYCSGLGFRGLCTAASQQENCQQYRKESFHGISSFQDRGMSSRPQRVSHCSWVAR